jgi:hypothetical protein
MWIRETRPKGRLCFALFSPKGRLCFALFSPKGIYEQQRKKESAILDKKEYIDGSRGHL